MRSPSLKARQTGFTLIELLVSLGIFLLVAGAAFTLLGSSQARYETESQVLTSFQEARLGLDQIVRDVNDAGYPPPSFFQASSPNLSAKTPFAWTPGYSGPSCQIGTGGGSCNAPGDFDLIVETNPNPQDLSCTPNCVQWIRYQLQGTTLMRGAVYKTGNNPDSSTRDAMAPFVQNVANNASPSQITQYQTFYPAMFPGGAPVPIFNYTCDSGSATLNCVAAGSGNSPVNIRDVIVTLIVAAPLRDATTGQPRLVQLTGRGRRVNPNQ